MKKTIYIFLAAMSVMVVSCRKECEEFLNPNRHYCRTYAEQFKTIWAGLDQGYVFWERQTIDWDSIYDTYLPVFESFDAQGGVSDSKFEKTYKDLLKGMIDHHMMVQAKNLKTGNPIYVTPGYDEVFSRDYYHPNYINQQAALLPSMEGVTNYKSGTDDFPCWFALFPGTGGKKIAYLRFYIFRFRETVQSVQSGHLSQQVLAPFRAFYGTDVLNGITNGWAGKDEVEAVILDLRGNTGGSVGDMPPIVGSFSSTPIYSGYTRVKEGLGRLDYSAWVQERVNNMSNHISADKKIVALIDVNSISCAEFAAKCIRCLPNSTLIGERTFGATCALLPGRFDLLYSGVFGDYNQYGYYGYTSNFDVVDKDYKSHEGIGETPDIECLFDLDALMNGHDNQLERALQFIRTGK